MRALRRQLKSIAVTLAICAALGLIMFGALGLQELLQPHQASEATR